MENCRRCRRDIKDEEAVYHLVRKGYAPSHFPFIKYEKLLLCPSCHQRQLRVDIFEKVLAVAGLVLVISLLILGFILLFSA